MRLSSTWWVLLAFLAIAAFFLLTEHRAHVFGVVPYLLLLACPLLHFFMHGRHGGHGGHGRNGSHAGHQQGRPGEAGSPAGPGERKA